jgi:hypothetical protein
VKPALVPRRSTLLLTALQALGLRRARAAEIAPLRHGLVLRPERGTDGFPYLYHPPSERWVGHEIQLTVPARRPMPEPLVVPRQEARMQVLLFGGLSVESAHIDGGVGNRQVQELPTLGTWHWWWISKPIGDVELRRPQHLGVQVLWPEGDTRRAEPMELFELPPVDAEPPQQWTRWRRASRVVDGADAARAALRGKAGVTLAESKVELPFELRCRAGLWETPYRARKA